MKTWKWTLLIIILLIIAICCYFYFTYVSPAFVEKPLVEKPVFTQTNNQTDQVVIEEEHIEYLVTEIGAYNLHEDPLTKEPAVIEINVTDNGMRYAVTIVDNVPEVRIGKAVNPDIRLHTPQSELIDLLSAKEDFEQLVVDKATEGTLWVEILVDEKTLAIKGYKGIYDTLNKDADIALTGNSICELNPTLWDIIRSQQKA